MVTFTQPSENLVDFFLRPHHRVRQRAWRLRYRAGSSGGSSRAGTTLSRCPATPPPNPPCKSHFIDQVTSLPGGTCKQLLEAHNLLYLKHFRGPLLCAGLCLGFLSPPLPSEEGAPYKNKDVCLKAKARLSYVSHIFLTAA